MAKAPNISPLFSVEHDPCLAPEEMRAYQQGGLPADQRHRVERHLLDCELCTMAFDDFNPQDVETIEAGAAAISHAAWKRVTEKKNRRGAVIWMSAAASVILLITAGWFTFRGPSEEKMQEVAKNMMEQSLEKDTNFKAPIADGPHASNVEVQAPGAKMPAWAETEHMTTHSPSPDPVSPVDLIKANREENAAEKSNYFSDAKGPINRESFSSGKDALKSAPFPAPKAAPAPATATNGVAVTDNRTLASEDFDDMAEDESGDFLAGDGNEFAKERNESKKAEPSVADAKTKGNAALSEPGRSKSAGATGREVPSDKSSAKESRPSKSNVDAAPKRDRTENEKQAEIAFGEADEAPAMRSNEQGTMVADSVSAVAQQPSAYQLGMDAYARKDFAESAGYLRSAANTTPQNLEAHLFAAISFLNINQPQAALYHLDRVLAVEGTPLREDAEWYKALAHLKLNEARKAETELQGIVQKKGKHSTAAKSALDKLK